MSLMRAALRAAARVTATPMRVSSPALRMAHTAAVALPTVHKAAAFTLARHASTTSTSAPHLQPWMRNYNSPFVPRLSVPVTSFDAEGTLLEDVELDGSVFAAPIRPDLVQQVVVWQHANARQGTRATKGRGEVRGSTRKISPQKGMGRARHGSIRAPIFRGGGAVHAPTTAKNFQFSLNKKMRAAALRSALSYKLATGALEVVDGVEALPSHKTAPLRDLLLARGWQAPAEKRTVQPGKKKRPRRRVSLLVVCGDGVDASNLQLAARNLELVDVKAGTSLVSVLELLRHDKVVLSKAAALSLGERLAM